MAIDTEIVKEMRKRTKSKLVFTRLDEETYSQLVRWADEKRCRTISEAIRRIIIEHLEKSRESVLTSTRKFETIVSEIRDFEFCEITNFELEKIIMEIAGYDQRTVKKYKDLLLKMKVIRPLPAKSGEVYEVVEESPQLSDEEAQIFEKIKEKVRKKAFLNRELLFTIIGLTTGSDQKTMKKFGKLLLQERIIKIFTVEETNVVYKVVNPEIKSEELQEIESEIKPKIPKFYSFSFSDKDLKTLARIVYDLRDFFVVSKTVTIKDVKAIIARHTEFVERFYSCLKEMQASDLS